MTAHPNDRDWDRLDALVDEDPIALRDAAGRLTAALAAAERRITRLEAQTDIRGRAVVMYRERAREAEAARDWNLRSSRLAKKERIKANARAEKAEKELDEAIRRMNDHSTNARGWMQTSEEWQATAEEWERRAHAAEQPHPLTADDITDSHVLSARLKANALGWFRRFDAPNEEWRQVLTAALTEPPRPEGAEDVAVALFQAGAAAGVEMTPEKRAAIADHLAAMGYRKDATR